MPRCCKTYPFDRPMTHDLFKTFIDTMDVKLTRIEVCDLKDNTFYAKIYCVVKDSEFILDARPSDAIALALRFEAEIFVDDVVVDNLRGKDGEYEIVDESDQGKKWENYLKKFVT